MKKFLIRVFKFSLLLPLIWIFGVCVYGGIFPRQLQKNLATTSAGGYTKTRLNEAELMGNVDVLVLGSSHAYRGFDPRIFQKNNVKIFNLGTSAQSPIQTEYLVKRYIDKLNPKAVLFEVSYLSFSSDGLESTLDFYNSTNIDTSLFEMAFKVNKIKAYNTLLFASFRQLIGNYDSAETSSSKIDEYIPGGYVQTNRSTDLFRQSIRFTSQNYQVNELQKKSFERTISFLKKRGVTVILIQAPILQSLYGSIANQHEFDEYFSSFEDVEYYNYNTLRSQFTNDKFYDAHHLNQQGVDIFNSQVVENLKKNDKSTLLNIRKRSR